MDTEAEEDAAITDGGATGGGGDDVGEAPNSETPDGSFEQIEGDDEPPLPAGIADVMFGASDLGKEKKEPQAKPEDIRDDGKKKKELPQAKPEEIRDCEGPPDPFSDGDASPPGLSKKILAGAAKASSPAGESTLPGIRDGEQNLGVDTPADENEDERRAVDGPAAGDGDENGGARNCNTRANPALDREQYEYDAVIAEAYTVDERDDGIVISGRAEPLVPWWKQRRTRLLCSSLFAVVAALAVTLGVALTSDDDTKTISKVVTVVASSRPSESSVPTSFPSGVPSFGPTSSFSPSISPTTLLERLENQEKVAWDESNAAEVTRDTRSKSLLVEFYSLTGARRKRVAAFSESDYGYDYTVSIEGNRTIVDFPNSCAGAGAHILYEKDEADGWTKVWDDRCPPIRATDPPGSDGYMVDAGVIILHGIVAILSAYLYRVQL